MAMTSDKAEWCAFGIWLDRVGLCSSTLFCASGWTFDSVITEKLSSPQHFTNNLPWMFLVSFCRTCSGISFCVNTWARYQIFPCLGQTMSSPLTHSVFYFVLVFFLFTVVCLWLSVIVVVMKIINVITFLDFPPVPLTISSSENSGFERQSLHTEFTLMHHMIIPRCTIGYPIQLNIHVLCQEFFSNC